MYSWQINRGKGIEPKDHMVTPSYQVTLPQFQGPLDLLLHLIEQQQLDITKVALAQVTDQYLQYITTLKEIDADLLSDFLVIAAKLLFIKSQALLPKPATDISREEEEDVGDQLVHQLRAYQQLKQATRMLMARETLHMRSYVRVVAPVTLQSHLSPGEVALNDLIVAARNALAIRPPDPAVDQVVSPLVITIEERATFIQQILEQTPQVTFSSLIHTCARRLEIIITFMAVLELIRQNVVDVQQETLFGEIVICRKSAIPPTSTEEPAKSTSNSTASWDIHRHSG